MGIPRPGLRLVILVVVAICLLAATVAYLRYGVPYMRHRGIQAQAAAFKTDPTQDKAARLALRLMKERLSQEDGQEIASALIDLKAVTEKSYSASEPIVISLASGNKTSLMVIPDPEADEAPLAASGFSRGLSFYPRAMVLHVPGVTPPEGLPFSESIKWGPGLNLKVIDLDNTGNAAAVPKRTPPLVIDKPGVYSGRIEFEAVSTVLYSLSRGPTGPWLSVPPMPSAMDKVLMFLGLKDDPNANPVGYKYKTTMPIEIRVEDTSAPE